MKLMIYIGITIGGGIGAFLPTLWGDTNLLSGWSILGTLVGSIAGLFLGYKVGKFINE